MLIKFIDSYQGTIEAGLAKIAEIGTIIAQKEAFEGKSKQVDRLYAFSILIEGIIDTLIYDDNSEPGTNEDFLQELTKIIQLEL